MGRLTGAQIRVLEFYDAMGPTTQIAPGCTMAGWRGLIGSGLLSRSYGLGPIKTEITPAGRAALTTEKTDG